MIFFGVPPDFFQILVKIFDISRNILGYPRIFFRFLPKKWFFWGTPRFFSDFCQKIWYFEKYFGEPPDFFHLFVKKLYFDKYLVVPPDFFHIFWGTSIFFHIYVKKINIWKNILGFSDFCQKFRYFEKYCWLSLDFFHIFVKKMIFHINLLLCYLFRFLSSKIIFHIFWGFFFIKIFSWRSEPPLPPWIWCCQKDILTKKSCGGRGVGKSFNVLLKNNTNLPISCTNLQDKNWVPSTPGPWIAISPRHLLLLWRLFK